MKLADKLDQLRQFWRAQLLPLVFFGCGLGPGFRACVLMAFERVTAILVWGFALYSTSSLSL